MRKLLIIYPHWPPSNLAGVHRPRLISNFLKEFGWHPIILAVDPSFYDEAPDNDMNKLVASDVEVHHVPARSKKGIIGDLGLRALPYLRKKALEIIRDEHPDFLWIPIPSFYTALLGRQLHDKTGIPYGIDYIDPWVDGFTHGRKVLSKDWMSNQVARILEPYCVKKASLISGVSVPYFKPVLDRNFSNGRQVRYVGMPYGFDPHDHEVKIEGVELPWGKDEEVYIYAGAFLPKSRYFMQVLFKVFNEWLNKQDTSRRDRIRLYFVGTGFYSGETIADYARQAGISQHVVEIRDRFPFLVILHMLSAAKGVMVIGSTEAHYTASKTFQAVLSKRPVLAMFHDQSSAAAVLTDIHADNYLVRYKEDASEEVLQEETADAVQRFLSGNEVWSPAYDALKSYSSWASAKALVDQINSIIEKQ
ncbi:MAG: hypothetical protein KDD36_07225 [Flavobacteriales bacterium]|nr:hypothetical protein [Flavobacteriales bacterium]